MVISPHCEIKQPRYPRFQQLEQGSCRGASKFRCILPTTYLDLGFVLEDHGIVVGVTMTFLLLLDGGDDPP
ncbi:hypothetical protein ES319_D13G066900v1 [Gossypium barbadense]|uniref:Uncharacterized protein n=1 Tax=Gossypium barbadense TaxID=3634 RepID=A0A5J5NI23_GOSBA|nr:hypothetical protein ES319_D13G066900v1 [Gossypium barbadense]